jgi:methylglyoxal/glyoxal reductase
MKIDDIRSCATLNNGVKMPLLGIGTYKVANGETCVKEVREALCAGYRHIDTASFYGNEESVAIAIRESGIARDEIFITTKLWNSDHGYDSTLRAFEASLKNLDTDYTDLYLIHWPLPSNTETWRAMERIYSEGRARAIGVSNFNANHLTDLLGYADVVPAVNQVEFHPYLTQLELRRLCAELGIQVEAWSPLMRGRIFDIPLIKELSAKYKKTPSQIVLRWDLQSDVVTIPKSITPSRIRENAEIFDFELSPGDIARIESLNRDFRFGSDPDDVYAGKFLG